MNYRVAAVKQSGVRRIAFREPEHEGMIKQPALQDIISAITPEVIDRYSSRKTLAIVRPHGVRQDEVLGYISRGLFTIHESARRVDIIITPRH